MTEEEKRLHRCCFTGHRPEKLRQSEEEVKAWLVRQIDEAIDKGYVTFISGMAMGVDIWAGQIIAERKKTNSSLHLIAAVPYPRFPSRWSDDWKKQYQKLLEQADIVRYLCPAYEKDAFQKRNEWMVDRSNRVLAYFNGEPGGTQDMIDYALDRRVGVIIGGL